jgi:hypothetical protein
MEQIVLKWGTLNGWSNLSEPSVKLLQRYADLGIGMSAAAQRDTPAQKSILCELLRQLDGTIINGWKDKEMSIDEAIKYIEDYGKTV